MIAQLPTKTNISASGNQLSIYTFYQKCINYMAAWINELSRNVDGISFIEGELGYKILGWDDVFTLNNKGELIVTGSNPGKYSISEAGMLTSDVDFCDQVIPTPDFPYWYGDLAAYFLLDIYFDTGANSNYFTDQITGSRATIDNGMITFPPIGITDVFNFSDTDYWHDMGTLEWYNPATPYTCPLSFLIGLTWAEYATDKTNMRMYHKDYSSSYKNVVPILVYKRDLTLEEQQMVVDYMNIWYIMTYGGAILEDRTNDVLVHVN